MYYNRNDRKVLTWLLCIAAVCCVVFFASERIDTSDVALSLRADSADTSPQQPAIQYGNGKYTKRHSTTTDRQIAGDLRELERLDDMQTGRTGLFTFDPNTASVQELLRLGLKPWQVRNLLKYRTKGGTFRKPEDFGKLYGLSARQYKALLPYIKIDREQFLPASKIVEKDPYEPVYISGDTFPRQRKIVLGETVDIATADTSALKTVPDIGSYFARKIVYYRNQLGGYVSVAQLDDISDFPSDAKKFLTVGTIAVRQIHINTATLVQMKRHPYMGFFRAKTIVDYRREHGMIRSLEELAGSKYFTDESIQRLAPYVSAD